MRRGGALLLGVALLVPGTAPGDETIARRLAALRSIAEPGAARAAVPSGSDPCAGAAWWRLTDYGLRSRIDTAVRDASLRYGVEAKLVRAVIRHESNFDPDAVSHAGARGLMQLMPCSRGPVTSASCTLGSGAGPKRWRRTTPGPGGSPAVASRRRPAPTCGA